MIYVEDIEYVAEAGGKMNKICLIAFNFGKLPNYFDLWLSNAQNNYNYDFILYTDDDLKDKTIPSNVKVKHMSFQRCVELAQNNFDFKVTIPIPYKFCDFRPAFGEIFAEDLKQYEFWGTIDLDIILGKIDHFITPDILDNYDKIMTRDHFCLYRNNKIINSHYKGKQKAGEAKYRKVFTDPNIYAFGERAPGGVYHIWKYNNWRMFDEMFHADIYTIYNHFEVCGEKDIKRQLFVHKKDGTLLRYAFSNGKLTYKEFMYMHLQKRNMFVPKGISEDEYLIVPNKFIKVDFSSLSEQQIKNLVLRYSNAWVFAMDYVRIISRAQNKLKKIIRQRLNVLLK